VALSGSVLPIAPGRVTFEGDERLGPVAIAMDEAPDGSLLLRSTVPLEPYPVRVHDFLYDWADARPDGIFLAERVPGLAGWRTISWSEAAGKVLAIAAALAERDLGPERPVAILSGNSIDHQLVALACLTAGVPYAPISTAYSLMSRDHGKLRHILKLLDPGLVFADDAELYAAALTLPEMRGREIVARAETPKVPGVVPLARLLAGGSAATLAAARDAVGPDTIAKFLFTSGSTGVPKGVIITQRSMGINLAQVKQCWRLIYLRPLVLIDWLPWNHVFGGNNNVNTTLMSGGTLYIDDGRPVPGELGKTLRNIREVSPTIYFNVPRGFDLLLRELDKDDELRRAFYRDLEGMIYTGAAMPDHVWTGIEQLGRKTTGRRIDVLTGWGLSEAGPTVTLLHMPGAELGNIGTPVPGVELKLVRNGSKLEGRTRGACVTPGYRRMPEATARAFDGDGFFITGDAIRFRDPEDPGRGFFFDGRVVEDFKLQSGTFVNTGDVRIRALLALGALALDVVVAAPNRPELGLLVFPPPALRDIDDAYRAEVRAALGRMNRETTGSSRIVTRAIIATEPPAIDRGEMTDKGSLNMRAVLESRTALVERLYTDDDPDVIRL
jgi:feruloyl-CoA synthase